MLRGTRDFLKEVRTENSLQAENPPATLYLGVVESFDATKKRADVKVAGVSLKGVVTSFTVAKDDRVMVLAGGGLSVLVSGPI